MRTPEQYAIEHGRYLADAARGIENAINNGNPDDIGDALLVLRRSVYEFEKRANRALPKTVK